MIKMKRKSRKYQRFDNSNFLKIYEKGKENYNLVSEKINKDKLLGNNSSFFVEEDILDLNFISIKMKEDPFIKRKKKSIILKKIHNFNIQSQSIQKRNTYKYYLKKLKKKNILSSNKKKKFSDKFNLYKIRKNFSFKQNSFAIQNSKKNLKKKFLYKSLDNDFRKTLKLKSNSFIIPNLKKEKKNSKMNIFQIKTNDYNILLNNKKILTNKKSKMENDKILDFEKKNENYFLHKKKKN